MTPRSSPLVTGQFLPCLRYSIAAVTIAVVSRRSMSPMIRDSLVERGLIYRAVKRTPSLLPLDVSTTQSTIFFASYSIITLQHVMMVYK